METNQKQLYEMPATFIVVVEQEGIVCASGVVPDMDTGWEWNF